MSDNNYNNRRNFRDNRGNRDNRNYRDNRRPERRENQSEFFDRDNRVKISGINAVKAAFKSRPKDLVSLYFTNDLSSEISEIIVYCQNKKLFLKCTDLQEIERIAHSEHTEGICAIFNRPEILPLENFRFPAINKSSCVIVLDGVGNPHNIGAIARSAAYFGADAVILTSETEGLYSSSMYRIAEGGLEFIPILSAKSLKDCLNKLNELEYEIISTSSHVSDSVYTHEFATRCAFLFGSERFGLPKEVLSSQKTLCIPGSGNLESLNVAAAVAVFLSAYKKK